MSEIVRVSKTLTLLAGGWGDEDDYLDTVVLDSLEVNRVEIEIEYEVITRVHYGEHTPDVERLIVAASIESSTPLSGKQEAWLMRNYAGIADADWSVKR